MLGEGGNAALLPKMEFVSPGVICQQRSTDGDEVELLSVHLLEQGENGCTLYADGTYTNGGFACDMAYPAGKGKRATGKCRFIVEAGGTVKDINPGLAEGLNNFFQLLRRVGYAGIEMLDFPLREPK